VVLRKGTTLFATGLGTLALIGWRRKRKARSVAEAPLPPIDRNQIARGWAEANWYPPDIRQGLYERGHWGHKWSHTEQKLIPEPPFCDAVRDDVWKKMDARYAAGDAELTKRAENVRQWTSNWMRMTPEDAHASIKRSWERYDQEHGYDY
jgi:hypothetical protein